MKVGQGPLKEKREEALSPQFLTQTGNLSGDVITSSHDVTASLLSNASGLTQEYRSCRTTSSSIIQRLRSVIVLLLTQSRCPNRKNNSTNNIAGAKLFSKHRRIFGSVIEIQSKVFSTLVLDLFTYTVNIPEYLAFQLLLNLIASKTETLSILFVYKLVVCSINSFTITRWTLNLVIRLPKVITNNLK